MSPNISIPLHRAAADPKGYSKVKRLVEEEHSDVNEIDSKTLLRAVEYAAYSGSLDTLKYLIEEKQANIQPEVNYNLLVQAAHNPSHDVRTYVATLYQRFADNTTPLHVAAFLGRTHEARALLAQEPNCITELNKLGQSALFFSAITDNRYETTLLLNSKLDPNSPTSNYYLTDLYYGLYLAARRKNQSQQADIYLQQAIQYCRKSIGLLGTVNEKINDEDREKFLALSRAYLRRIILQTTKVYFNKIQEDLAENHFEAAEINYKALFNFFEYIPEPKRTAKDWAHIANYYYQLAKSFSNPVQQAKPGFHFTLYQQAILHWEKITNAEERKNYNASIADCYATLADKDPSLDPAKKIDFYEKAVAYLQQAPTLLSFKQKKKLLNWNLIITNLYGGNYLQAYPVFNHSLAISIELIKTIKDKPSEHTVIFKFAIATIKKININLLNSIYRIEGSTQHAIYQFILRLVNVASIPTDRTLTALELAQINELNLGEIDTFYFNYQNIGDYNLKQQIGTGLNHTLNLIVVLNDYLSPEHPLKPKLARFLQQEGRLKNVMVMAKAIKDNFNLYNQLSMSQPFQTQLAQAALHIGSNREQLAGLLECLKQLETRVETLERENNKLTQENQTFQAALTRLQAKESVRSTLIQGVPQQNKGLTLSRTVSVIDLKPIVNNSLASFTSMTTKKRAADSFVRPDSSAKRRVITSAEKCQETPLIVAATQITSEQAQQSLGNPAAEAALNTTPASTTKTTPRIVSNRPLTRSCTAPVGSITLVLNSMAKSLNFESPSRCSSASTLTTAPEEVGLRNSGPPVPAC